MKPLLLVDGLTVSSTTGGTVILDNTTLEVDRGEIVALIGESGAGKTTLALCALGYVKPGMQVTTGRVVLDSIPVLAPGRHSSRDLRGNRVSYVAQSASASFNPALRLKTQVAEPLIIHRQIGTAEAQARVISLFDDLQLPSPNALAERYPHQVSGGQLQRAMTAMAVIATPEMIVFDEPTTALDVTTQIDVLLTIRDLLRDHSRSAIYVSHDLAVVAQIADRCIVMRSGAIVESGETNDILSNPTKPYTQQLLNARRRSQEVPSATHQDCRVEDTQPSRPALSIAGIGAGFRFRPMRNLPMTRMRTILKDVGFSIGRGEVVALVGESGSGKSTLARVVAGLHEPDSGTVVLEGRHLPPGIKGRTTDDLRRIQIVFQSPDSSLNPRATVASTLARPLRRFFAMSGGQRRTRIAELLDKVGVAPEHLDRPVDALSGGQKQRVSLARALAADPDYLICDEVLSALDTIIARSILDLVRQLQSEREFGCLFISHDLEVVRGFADRVIVLYAGRVCEAGPASKVLTTPSHPYTKLLLESVPELRTGWLDGWERQGLDRRQLDAPFDPDTPGCPFRPRCSVNFGAACERPVPIRLLDDGHHRVACHRDCRAQ